MERTAGVFLITNSKKMLICHPTNSDDKTWSIPKGLVDEGESDFHAAIRELFEETHIEYEQIMNNVVAIIKFDDIKYEKRNKYLIPYFIVLDNSEIMNEPLECQSMVETEHSVFPEVDDFDWVDFDVALELIHETQVKALNKYYELYVPKT